VIEYTASAKSEYCRSQIFLIFNELLRKKEALGENCSALLGVMDCMVAAVTGIMKQAAEAAEKPKANRILPVLKTISLTIATLKRSSNLSHEQIAQLFIKSNATDSTREGSNSEFEYYLGKTLEKYAVSQAICGTSRGIYTGLGMEMPSVLQKIGTKKERREKMKKQAKTRAMEEQTSEDGSSEKQKEDPQTSKQKKRKESGDEKKEEGGNAQQRKKKKKKKTEQQKVTEKAEDNVEEQAAIDDANAEGNERYAKRKKPKKVEQSQENDQIQEQDDQRKKSKPKKKREQKKQKREPNTSS